MPLRMPGCRGRAGCGVGVPAALGGSHCPLGPPGTVWTNPPPTIHPRQALQSAVEDPGIGVPSGPRGCGQAGHGEVGFSAPTHCGLIQAPAKQLVGFPLSHYLEVFPTLSSVHTRDNLCVCLPVCRSPVKVPFTG